MRKFVLRLFLLFLFVIHIQQTMAEEKETDNSSLIAPLIANYPLTEDFLLKLEKIEKECKNLLPETKNNLITYDSSIHSSIENYTTYISSKQKLVNILKENNITPKEFVIAHLALQATLYVLTDEENSTYEKNFLPSSNIEFAKEHMYRIIKILKDNC
ncbi:hypothetical protein [Bartonella sp. AP1QHHD]|uniref:hypothetical protein n=1 Tax=Bartonella sp. AP1QHHD TaxID=3243474 RepID=UPI0035CFFE35